MQVFAAVAAVLGAVAAFFRWFMGFEQRRAGRTEAALKSERESSRRGRIRKKVDADTGRLDPDKLGDKLRKNGD